MSERDRELAYIAGFFDGEGGITIWRSPPGNRSTRGYYFTLRAYIGNTVYDVLAYIQSFFNSGSICEQRYKNGGRRKKQYRWTVAAREAADVLKQLQPFLRIKNQHVNLALDFQRRKHNTAPRRPLTDEEFEFEEECYKKMKELNRKGVSG